MSWRIDTFEGFYYPDCGWEYDMPIVMVKPVLVDSFGGNTGYIDDIIENYMIDVSLALEKGTEEPKDEVTKDRKTILAMFNRAKKRCESESDSGKGAIYWKKVIRWNPENLDDSMETLVEMS